MAYDSDLTPKSADLIVLEKARAIVARGWCQNALQTDSGFCIIGALGEAAPDDVCLMGPWISLLGFGETNAAEWNDAPGRTQAEVLARFDEAISRLASAQ